MTEHTPFTQSGPQPDRLDELIDAIVESGEDGQAWEEFRALAGLSAEPWRRLAEEQRMLSLLRAGYERAVAPAITVELPASAAGTAGHAPFHTVSWRPMLGWAAAVMLALGWAGSILVPPAPESTTARESLLTQYLAQSHVVGELPLEVRGVSSEPGGEVITYVRPIVERRPVSFYHLQLDENSNPVLREAAPEPLILASGY